MQKLYHDFSFPGQLSQHVYPDLFLTTMDGGVGVVPAHRVVISAVSSKLAVLCKEGGNVVVRNIEFELLEKVIRFVYTGKLELGNRDDVNDLRDGMDMLKMNIVIENEDSVSRDDEVNKSDESPNINNESSLDQNVNLVVDNIFRLPSGSRLSSQLWGNDTPEKIKVENVERNQDTPVTASDTTFDASDEESGISLSKILDVSKAVCLSSMMKVVRYRSPFEKNELQKSEITCEFCGEKIMYSKYMKHCRSNHPDSPWNTRKSCGTCKNSIPAVNYERHLELFGHEEHKEGNGGHASENNKNEMESKCENKTKKVAKSRTKIPCDYCGEYVTLATYLTHCKKLHSISDADERCKRKCFKCGAKVHIVAEKFHHEIYHPAQPRQTSVEKPEPLKIVEHNKTLTKVPCDFCGDTPVFGYYKAHVKTKHPEVAMNELVKCSKCGVKCPKISFKFHRKIFHKSSKVEPQPLSCKQNPLSSKLKFPQTKISCTYCDARMKPHLLFSHLKQVHGDGTTFGEDDIERVVYDNENESPGILQKEEVNNEDQKEERMIDMKIVSEQMSSDESSEI